jgi:HPt (histidine-containing phosphotransfer) domain-containing protein
MGSATETVPRARSSAAPACSAEEAERAAAWTLEALRTVWTHQRARIGARLDLIERALAALSSDDLDTPLRRDAERAAHMLAGSLGMFGFTDAAAAARELEQGLPDAGRERYSALSTLLSRLRDGLRGPVALPPDAVEQAGHGET